MTKLYNYLSLLFLVGIPAATAFQVPTNNNNNMAALNNAASALDKPTRADIEKAAGQNEVSVLKPELGSVHGKITEPPSDCKCYTNCPLLANSPEIRDRLYKVTEKRDYSLFVAEKATKYLVDDVFSPPKRQKEHTTKEAQAQKEKLVILGAGWGSASFLRGIDTDRYDVTIISPRNYFLFTPMLAGSAVGTVDVRSITQPIREVCYLCWHDTKQWVVNSRPEFYLTQTTHPCFSHILTV